MQKLVLVFFICLSIFGFSQPVNDDCDFATILVPSADLSCTSSSHGTVLNATASVQSNTCTYSTDDDDVWYQFTATSTTHNINITNVTGSTTDMYFAVYSGSCSGPMTQLLCSDNNSGNVVGLSLGSVYYVRVYTKTSTPGQTTEFNICVATPPLVPANNECSAATPLFVNLGATCDSVTVGTITGATNSSQANACSGTVNNDVWYSFVATMTAHYITVTPLNESPLNYYHTVYGGTCASPGTPLRCSDPDQSIVTGLIPGNTYYVRVYSTSSVPAGMVSDFSICVTCPPTPPINDECVNATTLSINDDFQCGLYTNGTTNNALPSNQLYTCPDYTYITADDDVWYQFTATKTTHSLHVFNLAGESPTISYAVYSGNCTSLGSPILCNYAFDPESNLLNNLIIGHTYYIRVFTYADGRFNTTFSICVGSEPRPVNDECAGAIDLTVNPSNVYSGTALSVLYATQSADLTDCPGTDLADVWFKFTAIDTSHVIDIYGSYNNSADHLKYDVYQGTCDNFTNSVFCDRKYANTLHNLNIGETYYLKAHAAASALYYGTAIAIKTVPTREPNDNCTNATLIDINHDIVCDTIYTGSLYNATPSMFPTNAATQDDDVWVKFKADANAQAITIVNPLNSNMYYDLYFYKSCGDLTHFDAVSYTQSYVVQGLTPDSIYTLRISSSYPAAIISDSFELCIKKHDTPVNDDCSNALPLYVNPGVVCDSLSNGTIYKATASPNNNSCVGEDDDDNDDVWYTFEATQPTHFINLTRTTGTSVSLKFALYSGDCSSLTQTACYYSDQMLTGLTVGQTYFVRVYSLGTTLNLTTNFSICVTSPPANDECYNSIEIPVNDTFTCVQYASGDLAKASPSTQNNSCTNTTQNDLWYHFVVTSSSHWLTVPYGYNLAYSVYRNNCDSIGNALYCQSGTSPYFSTLMTNLTIGDTLLVRIYKQPGYTSLTYFNLCVSTPGGPIPPNDECVNAIVAPVNDSYVCDTTLACSITSGVSPSLDSTSYCMAQNNDVWYSFTAVSTKMEITISRSGVEATVNKALYNGNCGALGSEMYCGTGTVLNGLTVGNTYYLRIFPTNYPEWPTDNFTLCLKKYFTPPNDECVNAILAPVNNSIYCDTTIHCMALHATTSPAGTYCGGGIPQNDIWYKFVATTTKHNISLQNINNSGYSYTPSNVRINVYSGSCGSLGTPLVCVTTSTFAALTNLIIGNTYYIRIFNSNTTSNLALQFDLCITIPPPPPNDECVNAVLLQSEVDNSCTLSTSGTLFNATPSIQSNSCSNANDDDDVWYKFVATSTDHGVNFMNVLGNTDIYHSVYSGTCAALTNLNCSDPNSSVLTNLAIDSTYYVRVWSTSALAQSTTFKICTGAYLPIPTCQNSIPAGNDCASAVPICDFNGYCGRTSGTYTTESWLEMDTTFCGTIENNSFLTFTPDSSVLDLNVWVTSSVTGLGIQILIFDADDCQGPVENFSCWDPHYVPPGHKALKAQGLTPGHKYYMMIDGQSGDICDYVFGSISVVANPISISSNKTEICLGDSAILMANGGDGTFTWPSTSEITSISESSVYFKPTVLGMNSLAVSSFNSNPICSTSSQIQYQINVKECICPIVASNNSDSCFSNSFDLFTSDVFGADFSWSGPGFSSSNQNPTGILAPQAAGTYVYTVTATTGTETCSSQTTVVINSLPDATFSYSDTAYCINAVNELPTISGMSGGVFNSSNANLDLDASTGEINFTNSQLGNYQVIYTTPGTCVQSAQFDIDIVAVPTIQVVSDQQICLDETFTAINFSGSSANSYTWTNDNPAIGLAASGTGNINAFLPSADNIVANIQVIPVGSACSGNPISFSLEVFANPTVTLAPLDTLCSSASDFQLTNGSPAGGTYSGNFVVGNTFQVSAAGVGSHQIVYSYTDANTSCMSSDTIELLVETCLGVNELDLSSLEVYPNPTNGYFTIKLSGSFTYEIMDVSSKVILSSKGEDFEQVNLKGYAEGLYYIKVQSKDGMVVKEISLIR